MKNRRLQQAQQHLSAGYAQHQAGNLEAAEDLYRKVLAADPKHVAAFNLLATIFLQRGEREKFLRTIGKSLALNPEQPVALNNCGNVLYELSRYPEAVQAFDRALRLDPRLAVAHHNRGNALQKWRKYADAVASYQRATALNPDLAEAHLECGHAQRAMERHAEALVSYERALALNANSADAHCGRGDTLVDLDRHREALPAYSRALELSPDDPGILNNQGIALHHDGQLAEAVQCFERALQLDGRFVHAENNWGLTLERLGRREDALAHYDAALGIEPDIVDPRWNKALALLALGRYEEGWLLHECGLGDPQRRGSRVPNRRWDGSPFPGKRLLIRSEQGYGDALQFVRYAALCKERGGQVLLECREPLVRLLANCPYIDAVASNVGEDAFDYQIEMMSLPLLLGTGISGIPAVVPYLRCGSAEGEGQPCELAGEDAIKVGLVWAGAPRDHQLNAQRIDRRRSMELASFRPLLTLSGVRFYSLQTGKAADQLDDLGLHGVVSDLAPHIHDFLDTAAIIEQLDLLISVDTAVVHLAGALAKPVWVLSRYDACWRWLGNQPRSPWYPTAKVFGQPAPGDWVSVVAEVREALLREYPCVNTA